jgi:hypothetical protein
LLAKQPFWGKGGRLFEKETPYIVFGSRITRDEAHLLPCRICQKQLYVRRVGDELCHQDGELPVEAVESV